MSNDQQTQTQQHAKGQIDYAALEAALVQRLADNFEERALHWSGMSRLELTLWRESRADYLRCLEADLPWQARRNELLAQHTSRQIAQLDHLIEAT